MRCSPPSWQTMSPDKNVKSLCLIISVSHDLVAEDAALTSKKNMSRFRRRTTDGAAMHAVQPPFPNTPFLPPFLHLPLPPPVTVLVAGARSEGGAQVGQGRATATARRHWGRSGRAGLGAAAPATAVSLRRFLFARESNRERNRRFGNGISIRGNGEICHICCKFLPASWCR